MNDRRNIKIVARKLNSLDEFFKKQKVKRCDFLKVDCEGCEYDLLLSTSNQVLTKISAISCEIHLFDEEHFRLYKKLRNKLERSGFTVDDVNNPVYTCLHFLYAIRVN